jgi:ParB family chromosome partitioning protein
MTTSMWESAALRMLDPDSLLLDENIRTVHDIAAEKPELVESVRQHGVLIPVIANPSECGAVRVRDGQCRTLAARLARDVNPTIPVLVTDAVDEHQWSKLRDQWIANEIRDGFSAGDKARLLEQMALFGLTAEDIAHQLSTDVATVEAGMAVSRSKRASDAVAKFPQLDMLQAAALTEFEDDTEASATLDRVLASEPEQYDHAVARLRRAKAQQVARDAVAQELRDSGVVVIDSTEIAGCTPLRDLQRSTSNSAVLTAKNHAKCPGHAAYVTTSYGGDPDTRYVCRDWKANGHVQIKTATQPKTETEKVEARRVRQNNEAWRAATSVRRSFLRSYLARKVPPKAALLHVLSALLQGGQHLTSALTYGSPLATTLLGIKERKQWGKPHPISTRAKRASQAQITMLLSAVVLGAFEAAYDSKQAVATWRRPTDEDKLYFTTLDQLGYTLSTVERLVLDPAADADQWPELSKSADAA